MRANPGAGSQFYFTLETPIAKPDGIEFKESALQFAGLRVLIVDDNAASRNILAEMIRSYGMQSVQTDTADEALKIIQTGNQKNEAFSIALLDCHLPQNDLSSLLKQMKNDTGGKMAAVIMLVSAAHRDGFARCSEFGVDCYLLKPVTRRHLGDALRLALNETPGGLANSLVPAASAPGRRGLQLKNLVGRRQPD